jgi:hypothetical protein
VERCIRSDLSGGNFLKNCVNVAWQSELSKDMLKEHFRSFLADDRAFCRDEVYQFGESTDNNENHVFACF